MSHPIPAVASYWRLVAQAELAQRAGHPLVDHDHLVAAFASAHPVAYDVIRDDQECAAMFVYDDLELLSRRDDRYVRWLAQ